MFEICSFQEMASVCNFQLYKMWMQVIFFSDSTDFSFHITQHKGVKGDNYIFVDLYILTIYHQVLLLMHDGEKKEKC